MTQPEAPAGADATFPCDNCGAKLRYDATQQGMKCPYCGHARSIERAPGQAAQREIPIEQGMAMATRGHDWSAALDEIVASTCWTPGTGECCPDELARLTAAASAWTAAARPRRARNRRPYHAA